MKKSILWITTIALIMTVLFNIALAATGTPGTDSDPLITSSYLDKKLQEITDSIQTAVKNLEAKVEQNNSNLAIMDKKVESLGNTTGTTGAKYEIVNLSAGKKIVCQESTELILRSGKAKALGSSMGGLSDVTTGADVISNSYIESNHLLIIPRSDGRGAIAQSECILMVKGAYSIE
ncbi:MAG: hypothetical protein ACM3KR_01480 [Deltaproteobacteria bacterium]